VQINILRLIGLLVNPEEENEVLNKVLFDTFQRADNGITIGHAIVTEVNYLSQVVYIYI
jgi:hypothetical protein